MFQQLVNYADKDFKAISSFFFAKHYIRILDTFIRRDEIFRVLLFVDDTVELKNVSWLNYSIGLLFFDCFTNFRVDSNDYILYFYCIQFLSSKLFFGFLEGRRCGVFDMFFL